MSRRVFVTGATGYMGSSLIPLLLQRGHQVLALARERSKHKLPPGCQPIIADALNGETFAHTAEGTDTFVHLVGVSHPSPSKAREFVNVDLRAANESIRVAHNAAVPHFVFLSVAHPAPVMKAYVDVRVKCEAAIEQAGLNASILRPWYVLGPGHLWPYALLPFYKMAEFVPGMRDGATRLGLVTIHQMTAAFLFAVENPAFGRRVWEPKEIRQFR